ncbi:hypothetical protein M9H77_02818 [Catharanthus roseus]|uniref:Uncharacterized protein n=1 Tax=Catharanthus roseus TaxID=4058 RepID=A0ACC0C9G7_CATRO|nr:hypothetical protein M9H77_02818 [Catharanthus roseus]
MVRPGAHRGDDELRPVTDKTCRVQGRVVTASSRGMRGRHSTFGIPSTPVPFRLGTYYDHGALGSSTHPPLNRLGPVLLLHHTIRTRPYSMTIMDLLSHHLYHMIHIFMLLHFLFICLARIGHIDLVQVTESHASGLSTEQRAACYIQYLLGSSLFTNKSGNSVPRKMWPIVKDVRSVGLDILVFSYICPSSKTGSEVVQTVYPEGCQTVWVGSMHFSSSYSSSGMPQASFVARGTISSSDGDMDECPCCTTISVHTQLHALISPPHPSNDTESRKAPTRRSIDDCNSHFSVGSHGYDIT